MTCRGCGGSLESVFEMAPMPLAGGFAETRDAALAAERYPLMWHWCTRCGLVNVAPDIDDALLYRAYRYAASQVPGLVRHHAEFAAFLARKHGGKVRLLEIGSNDGVLLRQLPDWTVLGVDPSDIESPGVPRLHEPFTSALDLGTFDVVTSSNAFAHFAGIEDAIEGIAACLKPEGSAYIEVHDLAATLASGQWDTVYHEHKVEWSIASLRAAFGAKGLLMTRAWSRPLHGGLIRAAFRKGKPRAYPRAVRPDFGPLTRAYQFRAEDAPPLPQGAVAYGAAGRASVYLNQVETDVRYVVDGSPRRAGRYMPGTGHRIVTPGEFEADNPPAALITAWNHARDIKARHPGYDRWVTAW